MLHALRTKKATLMPTNFADALEAYAKEVRAREEAQKALLLQGKRKKGYNIKGVKRQKQMPRRIK